MIIRELRIDDAEQYLQLNKETDAETPFLYFEENERKTTLEEQIKNIQNEIEQGYISLVSEIENKLVGYAVGFTFQVNRRKHCMSIAIAMLQGYASKGIGTELLKQLIERGIEKGITRFELDVSVKNKIAINLYKKMGYSIVGNIKNSIFIDNEFVDEYSMAKII